VATPAPGEWAVPVGSPAKVVRELDDEAVRALQWSSAHYVENGNRFLNELKTL